MSAIPEDFIKKTTALSDEVTRPFAGARKIYVAGSRPDIRVPMREIEQAPTPASFGAEENPPITVYDTSGPFTDPAAEIDLLKGMPDVRSAWIRERADTEQLDGPTSEFGRQRQHDPALAALRFEHIRAPRRAIAIRRCCAVPVWLLRSIMAPRTMSGAPKVSSQPRIWGCTSGWSPASSAPASRSASRPGWAVGGPTSAM